MEDETAATPASDGVYVAPAIERREAAKGSLGQTNRGSYCPPSTLS